MKLLVTVMTAIASIIFLSGCSQDSASVTDANLSSANSQIQALEAKVSALEEKISMLDLLNTIEVVAFLTPGDGGYAIAKSDIGYLTVSLEDIQPYANGSKVMLKFGNTTSAIINGLNVKLEWGSVGEDGAPLNEKAKSRVVKFNETMRAGAWTPANVVLEGVPPAELGFVRVREIGHSGIRLSK